MRQSPVLRGSGFIVLTTLVDSGTFFILSTFGISVTFGGWRIVYGGFPSDLWKESSVTFIVIVFISIASVLLFTRQREGHAQKRLEWNRIAGGILAHDLRDTVGMLQGSGLTLENAFKEGVEMKNAQGQDGYHLLKQRGSFLKNFSQHMIERSDFARKDIANFTAFIQGQILGQFDQKTISIQEATQEAVRKISPQIAKSTKIICPQDFKVKTVQGVFPNVLSNLLKNASLHGKAKKIEIIIDAKKRTVTVRDDGKGIPPEVLPNIFQFNYSTSKSKTNSGTGLAFVHMVMETSGGRIFCHSKQGEGSFTEFVLTFDTTDK